MRTPLRLLAAVAVLSGAVACGTATGAAPAASTTPAVGPVATAAPTTTSAAAVPARPCTVDDVKVSGAFGQAPTITVPTGCAPPAALLSKDLTPGTGRGVAEGGTIVVNYHLVTWSDHEVLDSSFTRGTPFPVEGVGHAPLIKGWNQGLIGLKKDQRRLLVVPPDLGYGPQGRPGIKGGETLVFVIDGVQVS